MATHETVYTRTTSNRVELPHSYSEAAPVENGIVVPKWRGVDRGAGSI